MAGNDNMAATIKNREIMWRVSIQSHRLRRRDRGNSEVLESFHHFSPSIGFVPFKLTNIFT